MKQKCAWCSGLFCFFAPCLSSLTLLTGQSWRVRYALIRCCAILHGSVGDDRIRKTPVQPARLPGQMAQHHLPSHSPEADVRGSRPLRGDLEDVWPSQAVVDHPSTALLSHPFSSLSRLIPQALTQLYSTSGQSRWHLVHTEDTATSFTTTSFWFPAPVHNRS